MSTVTTAHIEIDDDGVAWIDDTKVKVVEVVVDKLAHGSSPEEIHFQYPHLTLAQIHAALAYYYDNQAALEAEINRRREEANALAEVISDSSLRVKLLALKNPRPNLSAVVYRRGAGHDTWHWCKNCSTWPTGGYEHTSERPTTGELCNECQTKQAAGKKRRGGSPSGRVRRHYLRTSIERQRRRVHRRPDIDRASHRPRRMG